MTWLEQGRVQGGAIVLSKPLPLPEGTAVTVRIDVIAESGTAPSATGDFTSLPFFGMWEDREDMADSAAWLRKERQQWQQRIHRQD